MASELKFDVGKLRETKQKCETLSQELRDKKDTLMEELNELRKDWKTPAGEEFFAEQDTDWEKQVESYLKITMAVTELLQAAITEYESVERSAKALRLNV